MPNNYTGKINRNTDWGGDASTGYLPVAGRSVQDSIKEELSGKVGAVYKGANKVYYFATVEDRDAFINTDDNSLVLYSYELETDYEVIVDTGSLVTLHSVIKGTTGNSISFKFKTVDKNGLNPDARAKIEISFTGSGVSNRSITEIPTIANDWTLFTMNVDDFLRDGQNYITVKITGMTTKATTQFTMTYNIFDLNFIVNFAYNEAKDGRTMVVPYIIESADRKFVDFFIDGTSVKTNEITGIRYEGNEYLDISQLEPGQHTLQVRAYLRASDGTIFYTPSHFYTFAVVGQAPTSFLMHMVSEDGTYIARDGEKFKISMAQFEQLKFDWSIYNHIERIFLVKFEYDGNIVASSSINGNGYINTFNYRPMTAGNGKVLSIYALNEEGEKIFNYDIDVDIAETSTGIEETTHGLQMKLNAMGKRNTDVDRDKWEYVGEDGNLYFAKFNNFSWNSQQGWDEETESLVISNGATVSFFYKDNHDNEFPMTPMVNDWARYGGALEIDIETFDIENEDAVICECKDNLQDSEAYIRITATNAELCTIQGAKIGTRFKDNDRLKIVFIGNKNGDQEDDNLIYIVVNGVLERAALFASSDRLFSHDGLTIGDPDGQCKVRLRSIRYYSNPISVDEAFNNFVVDSDDVQGMYEKNDVLNKNNEIGFDEVSNKLPVMIFTGDMNKLVTEGQSTKTQKLWYNFDVEFINKQEPERNFVAFNCRMKLQGTSSLGYPRKNFKLNTKDSSFNEAVYNASKYELDPTSELGNLQLRVKATGERIDFDDFKTGGSKSEGRCFMLDYQGRPLKKGKYRFKENAHKAQKWTLKADFMESSCSHNVAAGRSWNDIFENTPLVQNGDASYTDLTYKDKALAHGDVPAITYSGHDIEGETKYYEIPYNSDKIKEQKAYVCRTDAQKICKATGQDDIRTAVDGFPMVCFYRTSHAANDLVFIGQYNFINDKSSYEVFGFEDIEDPDDEDKMIYDASKICVFEGLKNSNPLSLFKTTDGFYDLNSDRTLMGWAETYEARYPDQDDAKEDPILGAALATGVEALYKLSEWIVSTRHEEDTVYGDTITIDNSFAKRINDYQYGYSDDTYADYEYSGGTFVDNAENRQLKFQVEKWEHFDVWKVAGYYVYLMRYGAVDQFVKNTMLFTDGNGRYDNREDLKYRKWFFINYDNDCLFGLRNNGQLAFHWDLNRQTVDGAADILIDDQVDEQGTNSYAMMGHDSTLWNNLEADDEFMRMVHDLDNSMTQKNLTYSNMVKEFDTDQTEKWCERIYNANERYKYIQAAKGLGDMAGREVDNLWMLQGTRRSHRHWWIANHFNLLDAQWLSGGYKKTYVQMKYQGPANLGVHAVAGMDYYFAWGEDKKIFESKMYRKEGQSIDFVFPTDQVQGNPLKIYAFNKFTEMDFSDLARYMFEGSFEFALGDDLTQNMLKKLVIGNPDIRNTISIKTSTWANLYNLEYLDITNYFGINTIPTSSFKNLHVLKAAGTQLGSFEPADGSMFELVELPNTISTLALNNISFANNVRTDLYYTVNTSLTTLEISNNDGVGLDYYNHLVAPWIAALEASPNWSSLYRSKELTVHNIKWTFNSLNDIRIFKNFRIYGNKFNLSGVIDLRGCGNLSRANIDEIKLIFGADCFNQNESPLYIITPDSVFISSENEEMVAGQENVFSRIVYPDERAIKNDITMIRYYIVEETSKQKSDAADGEIIYEDVIANKRYMVINNLEDVRHGLTLENTVNSDGQEIGILRCGEYIMDEDTTFKVLVYMNVISSDVDKVSVMDFTVKDPTYASTATIDGVKSLYSNKEYHFTLNPLTNYGVAPIGSYDVQWSLNGEAVERYVASSGVDPNDKLRFTIVTNSDQPDSVEISSPMRISATITNHTGNSVSASFDVLVLNENVIMTRDSNPVAMTALYNARLASNANAMTRGEAESATSIERIFKGINSEPFSFFEFRYFINVTGLTASAFQGSSLTEIALPDNLTSFGAYCFNDCTRLKGVYVTEEDENSTEIIYTPTLPNGTTTVSTGMFRNCSQLNDFILPNSVTKIEDYAFGGTGFRYALLHDAEGGNGILRLSDNLVSIYGNAFEKEKWSPETTTNKLKRLEMPATYKVSSTHEELLGREYESFYVSEDSPSLQSIDGVLYDYKKETFLRYPPKKEYVELVDTTPTIVVSQYAFFAVEGIDTIIFSHNVTSINTGVCRDSKVKMVDISQASISELREDSFMGCHELETVLLPTMGNLRKFGRRLFYDCPKLANINLPEGLKEFEVDSISFAYTFAGCHSLSAVVFPTTVEKVGINTVYDCRNVKTVVFPAKLDYTTVWANSSNNNVWTRNEDGSISNTNVPIFVVNECPNLEHVTLPAASYYDGATEETVYLNIINPSSSKWLKWYNPNYTILTVDGLPLIRANSRSNIKDYNLPEEDNGERYVSINGVIYDKSKTTVILAPQNRTHVDLEPTTEVIGVGAFMGSNIETITFSSALTVCNEEAFMGCSNFKTSEIVKNLRMIGKYAFQNAGFESIEIGENLTSIPQYAFYQNSSLTSVTFNNFSGTIGRFGFGSANLLQKIIVSEGLPKLEYHGVVEEEQYQGWYVFAGAGSSVGNKELLVSVGTSWYFTRVAGSSDDDFYGNEHEYNPKKETTWNYLLTRYGFTLKEEIPITGVSEVEIFVDEQPYTSIVYADSSLGHLVGLNDSVYSSTYDDGSYMFDLNGLYDGEVVELYSDSGKITQIGSFVPRIGKKAYQVGSRALSMGKSRVLAAPSNGEVEMADITKPEYEELVSRVNQLTKIIKNLVK